MKQIEELEKMDWQQLETAAMEEKISVPEGLEKRIRENLTAQTVATAQRPRRTGRRVIWTAVAAAAALAAVLALPHGSSEPEDTFDDPYLAYAQVEKTFQLISEKMSDGLKHASDAQALAEKPIKILKQQ